MHQAEFEEHVGAGNVSKSIAEALERAKTLHSQMNKDATAAVQRGRRSTGV
jgi:hypothetical protein